MRLGLQPHHTLRHPRPIFWNTTMIGKTEIVKAESRNKPFLPRTMFGRSGPRFTPSPLRGECRGEVSKISRPRRPIVFSLEQMKLVAINRPKGYLDECMRLGKLSANESMLTFTPAAFIDIRNRFPETIKTRVINPSIENVGLGDRLHKAFGPIGRAIHWPCMKGDGTTDLKPSSPCDKGRTLLNKIKL